MKKFLLFILLATTNSQTWTNSAVDNDMFVLIRVAQLDEISQEIASFPEHDETKVDAKENLKILCKQKALIEKKIAIQDELTNSEAVMNNQRFKDARQEMIADTNKWRMALTELDALMQPYSPKKASSGDICQTHLMSSQKQISAR